MYSYSTAVYDTSSSPVRTEPVCTRNVAKSSLRKQNRSVARYCHARQVEVIAIIDATELPRATTDHDTNADENSGGSNESSPGNGDGFTGNNDVDNREQAHKMNEREEGGKNSRDYDPRDKKGGATITRMARETNMVSGRWVAGK